MSTGPTSRCRNPNGDRISDPRSASPALNRACLGVSRTMSASCGTIDEVAAHLTEVKGHRRAQEPVVVPASEAPLEDPDPFRRGHAPFVVLREHAVRVEIEAAESQALVDVFRHAPEVVVGSGIVGIGVGQAVVLVRGECELAARRAAEGEPRIVDRWPAVPVEGELEQPRGRGVAQQREDPRHGRRVQVGLDEIDEELRDVGCGGRKVVHGASGEQGPPQGEGTQRLEAHEAAGREDAEHLTAGIDDGHVIDARLHHRDGRLRRQHVGSDRLHRHGHDRAHGRLARPPRRDDLVTKVDVRHDAELASGLHEDGRTPPGDHQVGRLADGDVGAAEERCALEQRGDRPRANVGQGAASCWPRG